jgi:hypothetical protein
MKKETLKDWVKKWSIQDIVRNITSEGMLFMARSDDYQEKDLKKYQAIMIKELKSRINQPKEG